MASVIQAENVSIRYITGDFKDIGLKEYVMRRLTHHYHVEEFWADRNISFSVDKGDMLGIIGSNGAGKSTLLKVVSGIMVPTEGSVQVTGKIAALLELSSGFDPDLTVRENAFLRGALLGYTREFMNEKYDEIIAFSELQAFQDRSFKQLSSGMKSRLAFSIACLVDPDVLILDEVLAVGDGAFRKKSENKMKEILTSGVTGILVSHSIEQIRSMCNKVLWLEHGCQLSFSDDIQLVCDAYEEYLVTKKQPANEKEVRALAEAHQRRSARELEKKKKTEEDRLIETLNNGTPKASMHAVKTYLNQYGIQVMESQDKMNKTVKDELAVSEEKKDVKSMFSIRPLSVRNTGIIQLRNLMDPVNPEIMGSLTPITGGKDIPFDIKRIYYICNVRSDQRRGYHSHRALQQVLIALSGSVKILVKTPYQEEIVELNNPWEGLYIQPYVWREMFEFSEHSTLLVLASEDYSEADYIRCYEDYEKEAKIYFANEHGKDQ